CSSTATAASMTAATDLVETKGLEPSTAQSRRSERDHSGRGRHTNKSSAEEKDARDSHEG
ncbi:MAG: hypothetical protein ACRDRB_23390, partial [Pseudonocardiaceae bacterium]